MIFVYLSMYVYCNTLNMFQKTGKTQYLKGRRGSIRKGIWETFQMKAWDKIPREQDKRQLYSAEEMNVAWS